MLKTSTRFIIVGIFGALIDFSTRQLLLHLGFPGTAARGTSYVLGSLFAYYANSYFTFSGTRQTAEKLKASVVYVACFIGAVSVDAFFRLFFSSVPNFLFWSWFFSQAFATIVNFILQKLWVFKPQGIT